MRGHNRYINASANVRSARGFTLVELLAAVGMIGILSAVAVMGYRKYLHSAQAGEAKAVIAGIRNSEEMYKAEMLTYLDCSGALDTYYPMLAPGNTKWNWKNPVHPQFACWNVLNVTTDGPVRFGYAVVAGNPGVAPPAPDTASDPVWPATIEPWYVIQAQGDRNADGVKAYVLASSFTGEIYFENDTE